MKHAALSLLMIFALAGVAQASCFADYKAKMDDPLRLQYGVIEIRGACTRADAENEVRDRLSAAGWQLLELQDLFDEAGLEARRETAGEFFLRF